MTERRLVALSGRGNARGMMCLYGISKSNRMPGTTSSPHSMHFDTKNADFRRGLKEYHYVEKYRHNAAARYNGM